MSELIKSKEGIVLPSKDPIKYPDEYDHTPNHTAWSRAFLSALEPKPRISVSEWADTYRHVGVGREKGLWRTSRTPYLREIMDAASDPDVDRITLMTSAQVGKTSCIENVIGYYIAREPTGIIAVYPDEDSAEMFSKERLDPTINGTPVLLEAITSDAYSGPGVGKRRKRSGDTVSVKTFAGGFLAISSGRSPSGIASRPAQIVLIDELDRIPGQRNREGSVVQQAQARSETYSGDRKIIIASTPHTVDDDTYKEFIKGDQRRYHVPCPHCGTFERWTMAQIEWDKDEQGELIHDTIRHVCPHCKGTIRSSGAAPAELLQQGRWVPHAKGKRRPRSYHIWSLYSPWKSIEEIVEQYIDAKRSRDASKLKTMTGLVLGWPYQADRENDGLHRALYRRREVYSETKDKMPIVPRGAGVVTCGVDVQGAYLVAEVVAWGAGRQSWGLEYRIIPGDPSQAEVWLSLKRFLSRVFTHESGRKITIANTFIDSGGHHTGDVYEFSSHCQAEGMNVYAMKGSSNASAPFIGAPSKVGQGKDVLLYNVGVSDGKLRLMSWFGLKTPGAGYCHWPDSLHLGYDENYFRGLISEELGTTPSGKGKWTKVYERNEPLDCRNYALAALEAMNPALQEWVDYYNTPV